MADASARRARAEGRARRRGGDAGSEHGDGTLHPADAARAAASAALAAAAVGAAQALRHRHGDGENGQEPQRQREHEATDDEAPQGDAAQDPAPPQQDPVPDEPERRRPKGDADELVTRARTELRALRGVDAEKVASISRTAEGWRIGLEVVEVRRIPESTDVLAIYEVELDGDGSLVGFERTDRYYRSEVERR